MSSATLPTGKYVLSLHAALAKWADRLYFILQQRRSLLYDGCARRDRGFDCHPIKSD